MNRFIPSRRSRGRRSICRTRRPRRAMAAIEVVMATAIGLPMLALITYLSIFACRVLFSVIGTMVGSPIL